MKYLPFKFFLCSFGFMVLGIFVYDFFDTFDTEEGPSRIHRRIASVSSSSCPQQDIPCPTDISVENKPEEKSSVEKDDGPCLGITSTKLFDYTHLNQNLSLMNQWSMFNDFLSALFHQQLQQMALLQNLQRQMQNMMNPSFSPGPTSSPSPQNLGELPSPHSSVFFHGTLPQKTYPKLFPAQEDLALLRPLSLSPMPTASDSSLLLTEYYQGKLLQRTGLFHSTSNFPF